jgi:hypothetical protein
MATSVFAELQRLLTDPKANFFPTSAILPPVAADGLPLLDLINNAAFLTPKLPLTISAVPSFVRSLGTDELKILNANLLAAITSGDPVGALKALIEIPQGLQALAAQAESLLVHQLVIGASLFSVIAALDPRNQHNLFNSVHSAHAQYFFSEGGYTTVADQKITPPDLSTGLASKAFFSEKTGERYVRDLTRVGFEAVANDNWDLKNRYQAIDRAVAIKDKTKAKSWFKGYSDFSEASVTSAVEQALSQGGGPVQANPLLAAGVATAAGTAARKATQHVFLKEIGI